MRYSFRKKHILGMAQIWDQRRADVMKTFPPFRGFLLEEIIKDVFFQV